jgi:hypothetical protein
MLCVRKKSSEEILFDMFDTLQLEAYKKTVLQRRYLEVLRNFHIRARRLEISFYLTRLIITVGSILVPALLAIQGSSLSVQMYWATWTISLMVTISNGIMSLFKIDKKYFFINTTLEMLHSEGWQYIALSGRYSAKETTVIATHENQFLVFSHMFEKIKMRQVEEEYWKFTDTSGVGNATNQKNSFITPTPQIQQGQINSLPEPQKNIIEQWVGDMNLNSLGLQRRSGNISTSVDGTPSGAKNPGVQGFTDEPSMSVQPGMPPISSPRGTTMRHAQTQSEEIPKNTVIQVVHEKSNDWE